MTGDWEQACCPTAPSHWTLCVHVAPSIHDAERVCHSNCQCVLGALSIHTTRQLQICFCGHAAPLSETYTVNMPWSWYWLRYLLLMSTVIAPWFNYVKWWIGDVNLALLVDCQHFCTRFLTIIELGCLELLNKALRSCSIVNLRLKKIENTRYWHYKNDLDMYITHFIVLCAAFLTPNSTFDHRNNR